jgi:hypothetical protein
MPEVNQYLFTNKELLALLIKQADIHEGKWMLMANFGFSAANFGPTPDQAAPGAVVAILSMGVQRATPDALPAMIVDAAEINPTKPSRSSIPEMET